MNGCFPLKNDNRGFTLLEILVVVAIIAVLAAVFVPAYSRYVQKSKMIVCQSNRREIERIFIVDNLLGSSETAEAIKDRLALEYAEGICPSGGVNAACFTVEDDKLSITCLVHDINDGAAGPAPIANWSQLAPTINEIKGVIAKKYGQYNFTYTPGQVYCANGEYFVFTGTSGVAALPKNGTDQEIEQKLYDDLAYWADIDLGKKMTRLDISAVPIVYESTEKQTVNKGDLTKGRNGELYIWKGNTSSAPSPDEKIGSWVKVLTDE